jgi:hypothetical protein
MRLTRTDERIEYELDGESIEGVRGILTIGSVSFFTVERGNGYKHLRPDTYDCECAWWTSKAGRRLRAIRILGEYSRGRIYIHAANHPHQLEGCIAPGMRIIDHGVEQSWMALTKIFEALGGWEEGRRFTLEVS